MKYSILTLSLNNCDTVIKQLLKKLVGRQVDEFKDGWIDVKAA
jgi:hypothetical protein